MTEHEFPVFGRKSVIDRHVHPLSVPPEVEVEGPGIDILLGLLVPFLILDVWYDLIKDVATFQLGMLTLLFLLTG